MAASSGPSGSSSSPHRDVYMLHHSATVFSGPSTSSINATQSHPRIAHYESPDGRIRVVARASGCNVAVLDQSASVPAQVLQSSSSASISCLRIKAYRPTEPPDSPHVLIAASTSHQLTIWSSTTPPFSRWSQHSTLNLAPHDHITSFDLHQDHVLVGTSSRSLQLWKVDQAGHSYTWHKLWSKNCPAPIRDVQWNHDGIHFAAFVRADTRVLVWHFKRGKMPVRKSILTHAGVVESITWRGPPDTSSQTDVLVTRARDGASRIWAPVIDQPEHLRLSASVDGFSFASSVSSSRANSHPVLYLNALHFASILRTSISLLERDVQMAELAIHDQNNTRYSPDLLRTRLKRLQHLLSDTPDVFLRLVDAGSTIVVRAVANIDRRPPTLLQAYTVLVLRLARPMVATTIDHVELIPLPIRPAQSIEEPSAILHLCAASGHTVDVELSPALFFDGLETGFSPRSHEMVKGHSSKVHSLWTSHGGGGKRVVSVDVEGTAIEWQVVRSHTQKHGLVPTWRAESNPDVGSGTLLYHDGKVSIWISSSHQEGPLLYCHAKHTATQSLQIESGTAVLAVLDVDQQEDRGVAEVTAVTSPGQLIEWQVPMVAGTQPPVPPSSTLQIGHSSSLVHAVALPTPHTHTSSAILQFATISGEGMVTMWKRKSGGKEVAKQYSFSAGRPIERPLAHCSSQGTLALVDPLRKRLDIYSLPSSPFESALQYTFDVPADEGRIVGMDWLSVPDNFNAELLALATERQVRVLSQTRATPDLPDDLWTTVASFDARSTLSTMPLTDVQWHSDGALVVAESANLHLLGPTVSGGTTLLELATRQQGPLPAYHPTTLRCAILAGRTDTAHRVIRDLANAIEDAQLEERSRVEASSVPPMTLDELSSSKPSLHSHGMRTNGSIHASLFDGVADAEEGPGVQFDAKAVTRAVDLLSGIQLEGVEGAAARELEPLLKTLAETIPQWQRLDTLGYSVLLALKKAYARMGASPAPAAALDHRHTASALHTTNQEHLLDTIRTSSPLKNGRVPWSLARLSNLFLWAPQSHLAALAEQVARDQFQAGETERDPVSCSLFYYALGNKRLVLNLWRQAAWHPEQKKMITFLEKDFDEPRWKTAACKNAFALLSQRRFEFAASFFMLGDSLQDAINVCVKNLGDVQLAITLARIKEGKDDGPVLQKLIRERVLPMALESQDRYLAHWCLWMMGRQARALEVLVKPITDVLAKEYPSSHPAATSRNTTSQPEDLTLAIIYQVVRSKLPPSSASIDPQHEWQFLLHTNRTLQRIGCHVFGLNLLSQWQFVSHTDNVTAIPEPESLKDESSAHTSSVPVPTAGPPEPDLDSLLSLDTKGGAAASTAPPQPTQGPPEPVLDDLLSMGSATGPPRQSINGERDKSSTSTAPPTEHPPEPSMDDLLNMGSGGASTQSTETVNVSKLKKDEEKPKKGLGSLMKPADDASQQGAQEFDMSSFGF